MKIIDFNSTMKDGNMNKAFFSKYMNNELKTELMRYYKGVFIRKVGLGYKDIFIANQKNSKSPDLYEDGLCYTLTKEDIDKYDDLYDLDVYADIVKLTPDTINKAIAYPVADCAMVKAVNTKTNEVVLSHCGGEYIDRYLPMQTIDALGGKEKDIKVYISPFAYSLFYEDATNLKWANNDKVWEDCKEYNKDGSVKVNIYKALKRQLLERKISEENLFMSPYDTITTDIFYSNAKSHNEPWYQGRFLSGIAIVDDTKSVYETPYTKIIK